MVRYAAETVPYYQDLFKTLRREPRNIRRAEDLDLLPLIDKDLVRRDPERFRSNSRAGRKSILFLTSGSTGEPLRYYHDTRSMLANMAHGEREREVLTGLLGRKTGYRRLFIVRPQSTVSVVSGFYAKHTCIPIRPGSEQVSVLEPFETVVYRVNEVRPDVLGGYGAYLEVFFRTVEARGIAMHRPAVVFYSADAMTNSGRRFVEERIGIPVLSSYNAVESFKIGFLCEQRRGFHIHEDLCYLKIVDSEGRRVRHSEKGEIILSNLVNRGTVLLNYRIGDVGSLSDGKCPCGRVFPVLHDLEGRVEDILQLPDGRFIHPRAVWAVLKHVEGLLRYQLVQREPSRFELKLVPGNREACECIVSQVRPELQQLLGVGSTLDITFHERLDSEPSGKFRTVISVR